jgi:hypothetical protein
MVLVVLRGVVPIEGFTAVAQGLLLYALEGLSKGHNGQVVMDAFDSSLCFLPLIIFPFDYLSSIIEFIILRGDQSRLMIDNQVVEDFLGCFHSKHPP